MLFRLTLLRFLSIYIQVFHFLLASTRFIRRLGIHFVKFRRRTVEVWGAGTMATPNSSSETCNSCCPVVWCAAGDKCCSLYSVFATGPYTHLLPHTPCYRDVYPARHLPVTLLTPYIVTFPSSVHTIQYLDAWYIPCLASPRRVNLPFVPIGVLRIGFVPLAIVNGTVNRFIG